MLTVVKGAKARVDAWQRRNRLPGVAYGVVKKFGDDRANHYVIALGWYGFVAIYPLLLAVTTIFAYIGAASLGHGLVSTLHQFPVVGSDFNPAHGSANLHGNVLALVVGLAGMFYGAQGVTQSTQAAMAQVWNVSPLASPGFLAKLVRSLIGLAIIGGSFVINAPLATFATAMGRPVRPPAAVGRHGGVERCAVSRRVPGPQPPRGAYAQLAPGAVLGSLGFTILITVGSGLIRASGAEQLRHVRSVRSGCRPGRLPLLAGQDLPLCRGTEFRARSATVAAWSRQHRPHPGRRPGVAGRCAPGCASSRPTGRGGIREERLRGSRPRRRRGSALRPGTNSKAGQRAPSMTWYPTCRAVTAR